MMFSQTHKPANTVPFFFYAAAAFLFLSSQVVFSAQKITVDDIAGRTVTVPQPVSRMVAIGPGATRLAVYLRVTGRLVGIEKSELDASHVCTRPYLAGLSKRCLSLPVVGVGGAGNRRRWKNSLCAARRRPGRSGWTEER